MSDAMSLMSLLAKISIPSIEAKGADNRIVTKHFADHFKSRLSVMQEELQHDEQLEVVAFLPSGAAVRVDSMGYENAALLTLKDQDQATGKACTFLAHQSSV